MNTRQVQTPRRSSSPPFAAIFIGVGLVLLGIMAALLLTAPGQTADPSGSSNLQEVSVVPVQVNFAAPELSLFALGGGEVSLAGLEGQVVLVNNWATWCPPCKAEMPTLQSYYEQHKDQGFVLLGIEAGEPADEVAQFVKDYNLTFPVLLDPQGKALDAFQNLNLPSSYVIDRDGTVRLAWVGAISSSILEKYVTPLLED
jgi:peroxiredoxin